MTRTAQPVAIASYDDLLAGLTARRKQLGLSLEALSELTGLPDRYANKIHCKMRRLGPLSTPMFLAAMDLEIAVIPLEQAPPPKLDAGATSDI